MSLPIVYLGVSPTSRIGVAIANYTSRLSRMWAWDASTLEVIGFQDLKGNVVLVDLDTDGEFVAYAVEKRGGYWSYVGVSRPPYFHALLLANIGTYASIAFSQKAINLRRAESWRLGDWRWPVGERVEYGCPFTIYDDLGKLGPRPPLWGRITRFRQNSQTRIGGIREKPGSLWSAPCPDRHGRSISTNGHHVYADDHPFLDLARQPFTEVVPPEWAKSWIAPRLK